MTLVRLKVHFSRCFLDCLRLARIALNPTVDDINPALPEGLKDSGNCGIFLIMGNAGCISSTLTPSTLNLKQTYSVSPGGFLSYAHLFGLAWRRVCKDSGLGFRV